MNNSNEKTIHQLLSPAKHYQAWALHNFREIPQLAMLSEESKFAMEVVGQILPFKTNNYVVDELIDWDNIESDPIFKLTFPQRDMLLPEHFNLMAKALNSGMDRNGLRDFANSIRMQLNPHPAGQKELNVPEIDGVKLTGIQHKYVQTVLFFPSQGQTCHAYCTFCFRWPQFTGMEEMKFAMREGELLGRYVKEHPEVTDVLFTGGDPMVMKASILESYMDQLIEAGADNLQTIRIGTKALGYWPYRFLTDSDTDHLMRVFEKVTRRGINLALMAHFNHPVELSTEAVQRAIRSIRRTGVQIRTQSPVLRHINDQPDIWAAMWRAQVNNNCIPYYMFMPRDTGAHHYFGISLVGAWDIFRKAYQQVSGVCRTVRGPSMSCTPGKIQMLGVAEIPGASADGKVMALRFLQGRNPDWVGKPFFAEYNPRAEWIDDLKPAFGMNKFFFEDELVAMYSINLGLKDPGRFD